MYHKHRFIVRDQLENINVRPKSIFLEPFGRNTAPAIVITTLNAIKKMKILIYWF